MSETWYELKIGELEKRLTMMRQQFKVISIYIEVLEEKIERLERCIKNVR